MYEYLYVAFFFLAIPTSIRWHYFLAAAELMLATGK